MAEETANDINVENPSQSLHLKAQMDEHKANTYQQVHCAQPGTQWKILITYLISSSEFEREKKNKFLKCVILKCLETSSITNDIMAVDDSPSLLSKMDDATKPSDTPQQVYSCSSIQIEFYSIFVMFLYFLSSLQEENILFSC